MVGIGIPTVGLKKYLKQTIDSLVSSYAVKLLVIDNNSCDGTTEWLKQCGYEYILNPENYGVARSWNQILNWARSHDDFELCFIMNNDIVLHPIAVDNMIHAVFNDGKGAITGVDVGTHPNLLATVTKPIPRYFLAMNFSCFGLTAKTIEKIGLFDENFKGGYFEDNDYHQRMRIGGIDCCADRWAPFSHYSSRTVREGGVDMVEHFIANREYFIQKWGCTPAEWGALWDKSEGGQAEKEMGGLI